MFTITELIVIKEILLMRRQEMADLVEDNMTIVYEGLTINGIVNKIEDHFEEIVSEKE